MKRFIGLWAIVMATVLVACGGGSADEAAGQDPAGSAPVARAGADQSIAVGLAAVLDGTASSDADGDPITFTWTLSGAPAGSSATLVGPATARPTLTPDRTGVYTVSLQVNDGKLNSAPSTTTVTATAPVAPQIVLDVAEPASGTVQLALTGTVTGAVTWYADLRLLGQGGSGPGAALAWNTAQVSNGTHLIVARIQTSATVFEEIRRTLTVMNSTMTLSASVSGNTGTIHVDVRAASAFGITGVSATLDGAAVGSLTTPNACSGSCNGANDVYRFTVDGARVASGSHTLVVTASDGAGDRKQLTVAVPVSNLPLLTLAAPDDGTLVHGALRVSGTASSDKAGPVTVTAMLGDFEFLRSAGSSFDRSYDLTGLAPGAYTLSVRATDTDNQSTQIQRVIVVTSTGGLAYAPLFALPSGIQLLALEGTKLLYTADTDVLLRDVRDASAFTLPGAAAFQSTTDWQISGGRVYVQGQAPDCASNFVCVYQWDGTGRVTNLSAGNPFAASTYQENPVAKGDRVIWTNWSGASRGSYTLYDAGSTTYAQVVQPAGVNFIGNTHYDFAVVDSVVHFYFWGQTGGSGATSAFDVFKWQSDTGISTRLTQGGGRALYTQTDGARAAWQQYPLGVSVDGVFTLMTVPVAGGPSTAVSNNATFAILKDGVLAWTELTATGKAVKASTQFATTTLSTMSTATLYASSGGQVIYGEQGKVYSWNSATGVSTLRLETAPSQVLVGGGAMLFTIGRTVYLVAL